MGQSVSETTSLCDGLTGDYSLGLHIGAIIIVFSASALGTMLPVITKFIPFLRRRPFIFVVAKTAATGVLLSVSTIHLLQDAINDFGEYCIPASFTESYSGYGFMFCIISVLIMHAIDYYLAEVTERWAAKKKENREAKRALELEEEQQQQLQIHTNELKLGDADSNGCVEPGIADKQHPMVAIEGEVDALGDDVEVAELDNDDHCPCGQPHRAGDHAHGQVVHGPGHKVRAEKDSDSCEEGDMPHGHSHAFELPDDGSQLRRIIAAICMEFGVTLHSVFVGLDLGLNSDGQLKPLLVALVFHQLFEGMSLGSRLVDAKFRVVLEIVLACVFSVSAPLGMSAATIAVSVRPNAMSGPAFVMMLATLNSFCAGILLYLAFNLLFIDFTADVKLFCSPKIHPMHMRYEKDPSKNINHHPKLKKVVLFFALWCGMGLMALVGKWL